MLSQSIHRILFQSFYEPWACQKYHQWRLLRKLQNRLKKGFRKDQCSNTVEVHGIRGWDWSAVMLLKSFILVDVIVIMVTLDSAFLPSKFVPRLSLVWSTMHRCYVVLRNVSAVTLNMYYYILDGGEMYPNCGHHDNLSGFGFGNKIMDGLNGWQ